jgi:hypothetical protein
MTFCFFYGVLAEDSVMKVDLVTQKFVIDGKLDEAFYKNVAPYKLKLFSRRNNKAIQKTEAWVCRDKEDIIIAFKCFEQNMEKIKKIETRHDGDIFKDDCVEVFLIPNCSKREDYCHLVMNVLGTKYDSWVSPDVNDGLSWDPEWQGAVNVAEDYWSAEIRIPFKQFLWGKSSAINLCRERFAGKTECSSLCVLAGGSFHSPDDFMEMKLLGMPRVYMKYLESFTFYPDLENHCKFQVFSQEDNVHKMKATLKLDSSHGDSKTFDSELSLNAKSEQCLPIDYYLKKKYQSYEFNVFLDGELFFFKKNNIPASFGANLPGNIFYCGEDIPLDLNCAASYTKEYYYSISLITKTGKLNLKDKIFFAKNLTAKVRMPESASQNYELEILLHSPAGKVIDEFKSPLTIIKLED